MYGLIASMSRKNAVGCELKPMGSELVVGAKKCFEIQRNISITISKQGRTSGRTELKKQIKSIVYVSFSWGYHNYHGLLPRLCKSPSFQLVGIALMLAKPSAHHFTKFPSISKSGHPTAHPRGRLLFALVGNGERRGLHLALGCKSGRGFMRPKYPKGFVRQR